MIKFTRPKVAVATAQPHRPSQSWLLPRLMPRFLPWIGLLLALGLSGCAPLFNPGGAAVSAALPGALSRTGEISGQLVAQGNDGNLYLLAAEVGERVLLAGAADAPRGVARSFQQPTWSPDGSRVAWTEIDQQGRRISARLRTSRVDGQPAETTSADTPFPAFYIGWNPEGSQLVYLSNWSEAGLALRLVDVAAGGDQAVTLGTGAPFYAAWSPDGTELLTHVGGDAVGRLDLGGAATALTDQGGLFSTPQWSGDGSRVYFAVRTDAPRFNGQTVGIDQFVAFRPQPAQQSMPRQSLVALELASGAQQDLFPFAGSINFSLSPDDQHMAFVVTERPQGATALGVVHVLDVESGRVVMAEAGGVMAFFWSPAGDRLLFLQAEGSRRNLSLVWRVWERESGRTYGLGRFLPSATFLRDYLPYFDQFAQSQRFWSADGSAFVFAGYVTGEDNANPGIYVQSIQEGSRPVRVADGVFAAWRPR